MNPSLPRRTPSELNVDATGVLAFLDGMEKADGVEPHSIMLLRGGAVIAEGWWDPYTAERARLLYSLSKSFTSTAAGFAVDEGLIDLDDTVISYFPELDGEVTDARARSILVRHALAMAGGHHEDTMERALAIDPTNLVRGFLMTPLESDPGTVFAYNQPSTYTVAAIVQRVTGKRPSEYLRSRLFDPLGVGDVGWLQDDSGREQGYSGMFADTDAIARLGQLYLQRGIWNGKQILSTSWIDQATTVKVATSAQDDPDWSKGYGFQFWMARHGYRGDGAYGQFCVVLPEYDVVLALTGQSMDMQKVLDLAWEHLLPAFSGDETSATDASADAALRQRLATASLPPLTNAQAIPPLDSRSYAAAAGNDHPSLNRIDMDTAVNGSPWSLTLVDGDDRLGIFPGIGTWGVAGVTAASAGWIASGDATSSAGRLAADVIFLETPHRLHLVLDASTSTFTAKWATHPLGFMPLRAMKVPETARAV
ncbi:CubicO group peptidase (beta-lactamase class C family) [Pseudarthrobacter sp. W1I19]|uniref:serine hydrolase domain-containing protein n=1 Tax=Pseudarthrobacter sp. W1I19 TaxID=3042288 RepID=UPI002783A00E|nr:serine hydrolase [Pseudarthrobacter sp. W1I19]MDQ0923390.1 CubicO group peptidase (beta-lactamase class C family) [Pseudarthrobacter sp. W1I19]